MECVRGRYPRLGAGRLVIRVTRAAARAQGRVATTVHFLIFVPEVALETMQRSPPPVMPLKLSALAPPTRHAEPEPPSFRVSMPLEPRTSWFAAVEVIVPEPLTMLVTVI